MRDNIFSAFLVFCLGLIFFLIAASLGSEYQECGCGCCKTNQFRIKTAIFLQNPQKPVPPVAAKCKNVGCQIPVRPIFLDIFGLSFVIFGVAGVMMKEVLFSKNSDY